MTITYNGHTYSHRQIWALVEALRDDGISSNLHCGVLGHWVALTWFRNDDLQSVVSEGDPGDRTSFRALCRAIEQMQMRQGGA